MSTSDKKIDNSAEYEPNALTMASGYLYWTISAVSSNNLFRDSFSDSESYEIIVHRRIKTKRELNYRDIVSKFHQFLR